MRRYDEPIEACFGAGSYSTLEDELPGLPAEFRWRRHSWRICEVEGHWVLADPWWEGDRVDVVVEQRDIWQVRPRTAATAGGPTGGREVSAGFPTLLVVEHMFDRIDREEPIVETSAGGLTVDPGSTVDPDRWGRCWR